MMASLFLPPHTVVEVGCASELSWVLNATMQDKKVAQNRKGRRTKSGAEQKGAQNKK
jgi:hypothetical protein